jgi:hypothetical protein
MIDDQKYDRSISMQCPTCGGTEFESESDDDSRPIRCPACGFTTTKDELIQANQENIGAHVDEIKEQVLNDLTKSFKDAFKGNKFIKIR